MASVLMLTMPVLATQAEDHKVTICHATHSESNPYVRITVDHSAVDGEKKNDHSHHTGPVWYPGAKADGVDWGDIIPPVPGVNAGQNWTDAGQAIWDDNCRVGQGDGECIPAASLTDAQLRDLLKNHGSNVADPRTANGSTATSWSALIAVPAELCDVVVSFSSYLLPGGSIRPFEDQVLFDNVTGTYPGDSETAVMVELPSECGWQVDLYIGQVIAQLHPSHGHPGSKLIDWSANQTGEDCEAESPSEEPTPSEAESPSEEPTPSEAESPSEEPTPSETGGIEGGNPTPRPNLPDTAAAMSGSIPATILGLVLLLALGTLVSVRLARQEA